MRWLPTQMIATLVKFSMRISAGMSTAMRRFTAIAVSVRSRFACVEPLALRAPRSNARMTRTPLSPSPSTRLSRSILTCMAVDSGTAPRMISANTTAITGITAISTHASCASCDSARMTPPIAIIGAAITMVSIMMIICCTWVVSLVVRVTSEADPNRSNWWIDRRFGTREDGAAQVPPEPGRHLGRIEAAGDGAERGHHRHEQHQGADLEDGALVACDDALVDDLGRQPGQQQVGERLGEGEHEHQHEQPAMRSEKTREFQHWRWLQDVKC